MQTAFSTRVLKSNVALRTTTPAAKKSSRLTELVLASADENSLLLPMLKFLSNQEENRWVTIISCNGVSQQCLKQHGVNPKSIRLVQVATLADALWMTWEALANGTSHTVITELGTQPTQVMDELEKAAQEGDCRALLVRQR